MKECKYCGSLYADNLSACPNCGGNKIVTAQEKMEEAVLQQKEIENRERAIAEPEVKKKKMFGVIAAILVVILVVIGIVSYNANKPLSNGMSQSEGEEILAEGIAYYDAGNYEAAIECFAKLPSDSKQYEEVRKMLADAQTSYSSEILTVAASYASSENYTVAIKMIEEALKLVPEDVELSTALKDYVASYQTIVRTSAIESAEDYAAEKNYAAALQTIQQAIESVSDDVELVALESKYSSEYRNDVISNAMAVLKRDGYEAAIKIVQTGFTILPNDPEFNETIEEFGNYAPVYLIKDLDYLKKTEFYWGGGLEIDYDAITDSGGNEIIGNATFHCTSTDDSASISFDLMSNFDVFQGTLVLPEEYKHNSASIHVYVYGDDKLLYQSPNMTAGFHTQDFDVDVSGISILTVTMENSYPYANGTKYGIGYLTNAYVQRVPH